MIYLRTARTFFIVLFFPFEILLSVFLLLWLELWAIECHVFKNYYVMLQALISSLIKPKQVVAIELIIITTAGQNSHISFRSNKICLADFKNKQQSQMQWKYLSDIKFKYLLFFITSSAICCMARNKLFSLSTVLSCLYISYSLPGPHFYSISRW